MKLLLPFGRRDMVPLYCFPVHCFLLYLLTRRLAESMFRNFEAGEAEEVAEDRNWAFRRRLQGLV